MAMVDFDDKAGNAGDVLKHAVLAWLLDSVASLRIPVTYVETHAGRGVYRVDPGSGKREHLEVPLPQVEKGPTAAAVRVLRKHLRKEPDGTWRYPGSPLFALELLGVTAAGVFFEKDGDRRASLATCLSEARAAGLEGVRIRAIGEDAWATNGDNKLRLHLQQAYGVGATSRPSTVIALVDPFSYVANGEAVTERGEIGRKDLELLGRWCKEVAAGAKGKASGLCAPMSGIMMVWTKATGEALRDDLVALSEQMPGPSRIHSLGIERNGERLDYAVVLLGYGSTGESVVHKLGQRVDGVKWERSALLKAWGYQLVKDPWLPASAPV